MCQACWDDSHLEEHELLVVDKDDYDQNRKKLNRIQRLIDEQTWFNDQERNELDTLLWSLNL